MLRVAVTRAVSRVSTPCTEMGGGELVIRMSTLLFFSLWILSVQSNAVRAFAAQASASTKSDFDALAAVIDSDEGRRQLANIRTQFLEAHVRLEELESQVRAFRFFD